MGVATPKELDILSCKTIEDLRRISIAEYIYYRLTHGLMDELQLRHIFNLCDALWLYPYGDRTSEEIPPHAELTSGKCSDGFLDTLRVLRYPNLCGILGYELYDKLRRNSNCESADWVIGSDHAGATFSYQVAQFINAMHDFTEKGPDKQTEAGTEKTQIWKRFDIEPLQTVLQVEELITTTATLKAVREGVRDGTPHKVNFVPVIGALIHRSKVEEFEGAPIIYLAHFDIEVWKQGDCPLCAAGSKRLKPKHAWDELTRSNA